MKKGFCISEHVPNLSALDSQLINKTMKAHMAQAGVAMLPKRKPANDWFQVNQWPWEMKYVFCAIVEDLKSGMDRQEIFELQGANTARKWGYGTPYYTGSFAPCHGLFGFDFPEIPPPETYDNNGEIPF
jgi:hypothetical protein